MIFNMIAKGSGGSPAISVVDTTDSGGGTVRTITASGATIPTPASDISKLILNGVTQMDVTDTTATVSDVASGKVFTQVDGVKGTGTASGGGGGFINVLETITVPSNTRAVNVDLSSYTSYDCVLVVMDATTSSADWMYFAKNGSSPTGGTYSNKVSTFKGVCAYNMKITGFSSYVGGIQSMNGFNGQGTDMTNVYVYAYTSSITITAGSKFYICGGNYADL